MITQDKNVVKRAMDILVREEAELWELRYLARVPDAKFNDRWEMGGHNYDRWYIVATTVRGLRTILNWKDRT